MLFREVYLSQLGLLCRGRAGGRLGTRVCPGAFDTVSLAPSDCLDKHSKSRMCRFFDYMYLHTCVSVCQAIDRIASALVRYLTLTGDMRGGLIGKPVFTH